jgi:uncharacterized membrane protein
MDKIINIFFSPTKVFQSLKEKPSWALPLVIVLIFIALTAVVTVISTKDVAMAKQEEVLKERGMSDEQIQQAKVFITGPLPVVFGALGAIIITGVILLIFALLINVLLPTLGGVSGFARVFSVVSHSALVMVPGNIIRLLLVVLTKSIYATTSLAAFTPNLARNSVMFQLLASLDLFVIWEMVLVAMGIRITNEVKKNNAYLLVFGIWLGSVILSLALGRLAPGPR